MVFAFRARTTRTVAASKIPWDIGMRQEQNWRLAAQGCCQIKFEGLLWFGHTHLPTWKINCNWQILGGLVAIRVLSLDMSWLSMASQPYYLQDYSRKLLNQYCLPGVSWSAVTSKVASATSGSHSGLHDVGSADWRKSGERDPNEKRNPAQSFPWTSVQVCIVYYSLSKFDRAPCIQTYVSKACKSSEFSMERCALFKPCSQHHHPYPSLCFWH